MKRLIRIGAFGIALLMPAAVAAQQYVISPSDTLRYEEVTNSAVTMELQQVFQSTFVHEATISVTFGDGSARAWYDALRLEQRVPGAMRRPATDAMIGQPFELSFDGHGNVSTLRAPGVPPEISALTDLTRQFDDFFITLPHGELIRGRRWADTLVHRSASPSTDTYRSRRIRSYVVDRDTVVDGAVAVVITVRQAVEIETSTSGPTPGSTVSTQLTGSENGTAIFAVHSGRLLARERTGSLIGQTTLDRQPRSIRQRFDYESRIRLLDATSDAAARDAAPLSAGSGRLRPARPTSSSSAGYVTRAVSAGRPARQT